MAENYKVYLKENNILYLKHTIYYLEARIRQYICSHFIACL